MAVSCSLVGRKESRYKERDERGYDVHHLVPDLGGGNRHQYFHTSLLLS